MYWLATKKEKAFAFSFVYIRSYKGSLQRGYCGHIWPPNQALNV